LTLAANAVSLIGRAMASEKASSLPFLYFGRAQDDTFIERRMTCYVWLKEPLAEIPKKAEKLIPPPLKGEVHLDGRLLVIASDDQLKANVKKRYAKKDESLGTIRSKAIPNEYKGFVAEFTANYTKPSVWDRLFDALEAFLFSLPVEVAVVDWFKAKDYSPWHKRSVAECGRSLLHALAEAPTPTDERGSLHLRGLISALLYFASDDRSLYAELAHDERLQTLFGRVTGDIGGLVLALMGGKVTDDTLAMIAQRSRSSAWVLQRGISDAGNVLCAPCTGGWAIQWGTRVFYLREPIHVKGTFDAVRKEFVLSMPQWGIHERDINHAPWNFAKTVDARYERLIVGKQTPADADERTFVEQFNRIVERVVP
jgi:hypothetical protein